jgi:N-acetylneuraminate synthase
MLCFSTPFDETAVDFLEELDMPAYKIASPEIIHLPLVKKVAAIGKPIIISTGMASVSEIDEAVYTVRAAGCEQFVLLKCTSTYPALPENSNVLTIPHMRELFGCEVGLSDHTMGVGAAVAAVAHGATVIEKHFTLNRADGGVDSAFSMEPEEMKALVIETERAWQSLGKVKYGPSEAEKESLTFRRSIYIAENMQKGDILNEKNMRIVRPGLGLPPKYYDILLGRKVSQDVKKGTAVGWNLIG